MDSPYDSRSVSQQQAARVKQAMINAALVARDAVLQQGQPPAPAPFGAPGLDPMSAGGGAAPPPTPPLGGMGAPPPATPPLGAPAMPGAPPAPMSAPAPGLTPSPSVAPGGMDGPLHIPPMMRPDTPLPVIGGAPASAPGPGGPPPPQAYALGGQHVDAGAGLANPGQNIPENMPPPDEQTPEGVIGMRDLVRAMAHYHAPIHDQAMSGTEAGGAPAPDMPVDDAGAMPPDANPALHSPVPEGFQTWLKTTRPDHAGDPMAADLLHAYRLDPGSAGALYDTLEAMAESRPDDVPDELRPFVGLSVSRKADTPVSSAVSRRPVPRVGGGSASRPKMPRQAGATGERDAEAASIDAVKPKPLVKGKIGVPTFSRTGSRPRMPARAS